MREIKLTVRGDTVHASRHRAGIQGEANATALVVSFDESWKEYSKTITFWDALEQNPVQRVLTTDLWVDPHDELTYRTTIPGEPLAVAGECVLVIDGYVDGVRARSMSVRLEVEEAPMTDSAEDPADPIIPVKDQLQMQIDDIKYEIGIVSCGVEEVQEIKVQVEQWVLDAQASAEAAQNSADQASGSASAAASSKSGAQTAAGNAQSSANSAAASEQLAFGYKQDAESAAEQAESYTSHPPIIGSNGNWFGWDGAEYKDTGKPSRGEKGATGERGATGATGAPGKDGYTPQRGVDYWTAEDAAQVVADVLSSLPVYNGEVEEV